MEIDSNNFKEMYHVDLVITYETSFNQMGNSYVK